MPRSSRSVGVRGGGSISGSTSERCGYTRRVAVVATDSVVNADLDNGAAVYGLSRPSERLVYGRQHSREASERSK
jgi:hypothetical protein